LVEITKFENMKVEFVNHATPTAHLYDDTGKEVDQFVLGDKNLEEILQLFEEHNFPLVLKDVTHLQAETLPSSITQIGSNYYELYENRVSFLEARKFAETKKKGDYIGRILTYNCSFQEAHIRSWLNKLLITHIWLGGEREERSKLFAWSSGPLKGVQFQGNSQQYSNWRQGEPNNADNDENCATQSLGEEFGWNDVNCATEVASVIVEYGKVVVPCSEASKRDPNIPFQQSVLQAQVEL